MHPAPRSALLAGATGLVGRALLPRLLESPRYAQVNVLLRRAAPDLPAHPKLRLLIVDFEHLPALPAVDDAFIALGTTIRTAGSQAAFRKVDVDAVVATARAAREAGARRIVVVSALGANAGSGVFYNRMKGQMQQAVSALGFESVVFMQPSLLVGDREALGQPVRSGEVWATRLLRPVMRWVPRGVRPIEASRVAQAMLEAAADSRTGVRIVTSADMQAAGSR